MNWIDWALIMLIGFAAVRGFMHGFIRELCGLAGLVLGVWGAIHLNEHVAHWLGLEEQHEAVAFLITLVFIVVLLHILGHLLTQVIDAAQLSLPNKLGGILVGALRTVFLLSVVLNILFAKHDSAWAPPLKTMQDSALAKPLRAFAPAIIPALRETKWVKRVIDDVKEQFEGLQ